MNATSLHMLLALLWSLLFAAARIILCLPVAIFKCVQSSSVKASSGALADAPAVFYEGSVHHIRRRPVFNEFRSDTVQVCRLRPQGQCNQLRLAQVPGQDGAYGPGPTADLVGGAAAALHDSRPSPLLCWHCRQACSANTVLM